MFLTHPTVLACARALAAVLAASCDTEPPQPAPSAAKQDRTPADPVEYDFSRPLRTFALPAALREISAVTAIDADTVACLQDEKGVLFFVDVHDGRLREVRPFGPEGDYEGLARVGDDYWVLRSDGWLARLEARGPRLSIAESFELDTPNHDLEGLCHDPARGVLLIAPKDVIATAKKRTKRTKEERRAESRGEEAEGSSREPTRDRRVVFGWDLERRSLLPEPVLRLSLEELKRRAEARGHDLPTKTNKKGKERTVLRLLFSCVAVHPKTGEVYLLSAADHALIVVDRKGALRDLHLLDEDVLPQPEGLTFLPGGDLVLSSEGVDGPARLVVYGQR